MKSKILHIALSVVIAFALWLYVISTVSPESEETFYDIPVSYQNDLLEERGLMIVSEKPTVTLTLKGNRSDLNELNANNITILVNLAAIQAPGTQMVKYDVSYPSNLPNNAFEVLSQTPNLLQLKVENKVKKSVPVVVDFMDTKVPDGYIADKENLVMDVSYVEIAGPESAVKLVDHALIQVDLTDRSESIIGAFSYTLCDETGEPVDGEMLVTNTEEINLSVKIEQMKEVKLVLNILAGGGATNDSCTVELDTQSIWVSGSEAKLRDLTFVELGTVNLAELKKTTNTLTFDVVLPEGVTNKSGVSQVNATVSFPDLARKKLQISKEFFQTANLPAGATVTWITEVLEIELRGPKDLMQTITPADVTVTLDFEGEEPGNISKVPRITLSGEYAGVGAITVPAVAAAMQVVEAANAAVG